MSLANFVQDLQAACGHADAPEEHWKEVQQYVSRADVETTLRGNQSELNSVLEALDPTLCTLGWLAVLGARDPRLDLERYLHQMALFLAQFNADQARLWPMRFTQVCRQYTDALVQINKPMRGIDPLRTGLLRFQPTPETITPLHAMVAKLCLLSHAHAAMLPLLETDLSAIGPDVTGTDVEDVLLYLYYGGLVYVGLRRFEDARDMFLNAVTAPASAISAIAVEAYKKYVLCSLLVEGKLAPLPRYTSVHLARALRTKGKAYEQFAEAFQQHDASAAKKAAQKHQAAFSEDGNAGLVQHCMVELDRRVLLRLTRTFLTLSLADIAQHVGLSSAAEAERMVLEMIETGQIRARISQEDSMVSFTEATDNFDTSAAMHALNTTIKHILAVNDRVDALDTALLTSRAYQTKVKTSASRGRGDKGPHGFVPPGAPGSESERELFAD